MATRSIIAAKVQDSETFTYSATILQEDGVTPVALDAATTTVLLSLYNSGTNVSIAGRLAQSVITAGVASNEHTGTALGVLTFKSLAADSTLGLLVNTPVVARYSVTYTDALTVVRTGIHEVQFTVEPLVVVT